MWENFGPMHIDRCVAVARYFGGDRKVIGIELAGQSDTYDWEQTNSLGFVKYTLFPGTTVANLTTWKLFWALLRISISIGPADFFFCRYESISTLFTSVILRLLGRRVFTMNDSKFDDKPRRVWKELLKSFYFTPYSGALVASRRAGEYLEFLRFPKKKIAFGYDAISVARIREQAGSPPAPSGEEFRSRCFSVVARMVPKKNLFVVLEAFAHYTRLASTPRSLHFCGAGPIEQQVKHRAEELGLTDLIVFHGSVDSAAVSKVLSKTLALILVSTEEQFGLVIPEALSMGVPVIASGNCGACDELVRSGINGFVVEPDNPSGIAYFMALIGSDSRLWTKMALAATEKAPLADAARFAEACEQLTVR
jgi:glycosyltransferase involved in cell wall biosynthesis